ncbi:MAG: hypothetical protein K2L84_09140 [Muribaculaceae bacterium]|nr:hypothetical protein [Muribaculaceae bacterium]
MTLIVAASAVIMAPGLDSASAITQGELRRGNYVYTGGVTDGKQNGYGVCRYTNGNVYYGFWNMGYKDGLGRMDYADGTMEFGNWQKGHLPKSKGRKFHTGDKVYGIDVAKYQKTVDWTKLSLAARADGSVVASRKKAPYLQPVLFALIKSTEGTTILDPYFKTNFKEAKRCGIIRGAYHFLSVNSPVEEQVKYFIKNTPLEPGDLPPVLDLEINKAVMQKQHAKVCRMAKKWLKEIEKHYGVKPIIYTYNNYYIDYLKGHGMDDYDFWIARYGQEPSARHWEIWQLTDKGVCTGINHAVDIDYFRGNIRDLRKYVKEKGMRRPIKASVKR